VAPAFSASATEVTFAVPTQSFFYGSTSRFSENSAKVFSLAIERIFTQLNCRADIQTQRRDAVIDSNKLEMQIIATCPQALDIGFETLTTENIQRMHWLPDLLYVNGRLVSFEPRHNLMVYSDGEPIRLENLGNRKYGYVSHPSLAKNLDHIDSSVALRSQLSRSNFKIGGTVIGLGGLLAALQSFTAEQLLFKLYYLLGNPTWFAPLWNLRHLLLANAGPAEGAAAVSIAAGAFIVLIGVPFDSQAADMHSAYRRPEYRDLMLKSEAYKKLQARLGDKADQVVATYLKPDTKPADLIRKFSRNADDRETLVNFYNWWATLPSES
jgi:hypothetical protein